MTRNKCACYSGVPASLIQGLRTGNPWPYLLPGRQVLPTIIYYICGGLGALWRDQGGISLEDRSVSLKFVDYDRVDYAVVLFALAVVNTQCN